jgi:ATP-dependent RNA helicase HelY
VAGAFERQLPFALDDFQSTALTSLEDGNNVLVAAPTGAGKTVVADFAMFLAQRTNVKAFYTTPIKALSNQKYHDLVEEYGQDQVGLLTGDTSINSEANIVVMTTEVLRNMIYERSTTLDALKYVILDEIHYLGDRFRGQVWEEVIIHLPQRVKIVGLSATVSNIEDFGSWIESVRGSTKLIVSETRPVPLDQSVMVQPSRTREPEIFDLYQSQAASSSAKKNSKKAPAASKRTPRVNPELISRIRELDHLADRRAPERESRRGGRNRENKRSQRGSRRFTPARWAVVDELDYLDLLPGIYFIFSRVGCDAAVEQCLHAGLELTTDDEARRIRRIADDMVTGTMSTQDLKALHYSSFRFALEQGFAAHHAGMVSLFREIVEKVFEEGLAKVVFATETLALGINMPARSVIIEKLEKFDGADHVPLTPGEYTQLTGRAGRRGIDTLGHAVVVDHARFDPTALAALSSRRVYPLHSQFSPSFNMAVNLLNVHDYATARHTLDQSFAQWEASESSVELESSISKLSETLQEYEKAFTCDFGDFKELLLLRAHLTELERSGRRSLKHQQFASEKARREAFAALDREIAVTRATEQAHPCRSCPDLAAHMKWGNRWLRERKELERLQSRYDYRTGVVSRRFDLICSVLEDLDYLTEARKTNGAEDHDYSLTWRGQLLRRLYTEKDLLFAECLTHHVFDGLNAQQLAAVVSGVVYESRRSSSSEPRHYPGGRNGAIATATQQMEEIWEDLNYTLEEANLDPLQKLDFGIIEAIFDWSADKPLAQVLDVADFGAGDFVRTCKRLCDVLGQLETAVAYLPSGGMQLRKTAREAYDLINRGVVAYSGTDPKPEDEMPQNIETSGE